MIQHLEDEDIEVCETHGDQKVVDSNSTWGYAGPIYWADLACGCQHVDASADDLDAAR